MAFGGRALIVENGAAGNCRGQLFTAVEARGGQDVADAPVEAFNHTVGLPMPRPDQAVLDTKPHANACLPDGSFFLLVKRSVN